MFRVTVILLVSLISLLLVLFAAAQFTGRESSLAGIFEEVTDVVGLSSAGPSFGVAWGDFDNDGWPDIWVNNHQFKPSLFRNNGGNSFTNIIDQVWSGRAGDDAHGAAWADFDNDGDQDLLETVGALRNFLSGPDPRFANNFYINDGGVLRDEAEARGLDYIFARGRHVTWFDYGGDGLLDVLVTAATSDVAPSRLFLQTDGNFSSGNDSTGAEFIKASTHAQLAGFCDGIPKLVVHSFKFPENAYDFTVLPFANVTPDLRFPPQDNNHVWDSAIADFNGDSRPDVFLVRVDPIRSEFFLIDDHTLHMRLFEQKSGSGISFQSDGMVSFTLGPAWFLGVTPERIFLGANGIHPQDVSFTLSPDDPQVAGIKSHIRGEDIGVFIGFDPGTRTWSMLYSTNSIDILPMVDWIITTENPIPQIVPDGFDPFEPPLSHLFWVCGPDGMEDGTAAAGLGERSFAKSVVAGDFDNDMDMDLYFVEARALGNSPNLLFENLGDGTFAQVPGAGGAPGSTLGRGDSVTIADYDRDCFLDLFVTNGNGLAPFNDGPLQLYRNIGNGNHCLEIDLEGIRSNRDGIGATVILTTPDGTVQTKMQDGGVHFRSQNHKRLHFGLGQNTMVESLEILWPSGIRQMLTDIPADQVLAVIEETTDPIGPAVRLSAKSLTFGEVNRGDSSPPQPVMLSNTGRGALTLFSITSGDDYTQTNDCGNVVDTGTNCSIEVTFTPVADGPRMGTLSIETDALDSPHSVTLQGPSFDFSLALSADSPLTQTVNVGGVATYGLTLVPNGFQGTVFFLCSGIPAFSTCDISPESVTLDGMTSENVAVIVKTGVRSLVAPPQLPNPPERFDPSLYLLVLLSMAFLIRVGMSRRARAGWALGAVLLMVVIGSFGCGNNAVLSTPTGNFTITVLATNGRVTHTAQLFLTVR